MGRPKKDEAVDEVEEVVNFYSEIDKGSEYPSWYFDTLREKLEDSVNYKRAKIESPDVPYETKLKVREELKSEEARLANIKDSKPKLSNKLRDKISEAREELGKEISRTMHSYADMERGTTSGHDEAKRLSDPVVKISASTVKTLNLVGIEVKESKLTGLQAEKYWKLFSKSIDESTNTETLRRKK